MNDLNEKVSFKIGIKFAAPFYMGLETFMGVEQRAGPGANPRISRVVSKSDSD